MKKCMELAAVFFRLGLVLIGGGYAMLPVLRREVVERLRWVSDEELLNYYAIGQSTPGIIAINTATFIGYRRAGVAGAVCATTAMLIPALACIMIIAAFFDRFSEWPLAQRAFQGMRVAVAWLLVATVYQLTRTAVTRYFERLLAVGALLVVAVLGFSPVPVLLAAGTAGLLAGTLRGARP